MSYDSKKQDLSKKKSDYLSGKLKKLWMLQKIGYFKMVEGYEEMPFKAISMFKKIYKLKDLNIIKNKATC